MGQLIKQFQDGSFLEYDRGKFDPWCVYLTKPNGGRRPPRDMDYFNELKSFAAAYGTQKVYGDYVRVYDMTGAQVDNNVLNSISAIANSYGQDVLQMDVMLSILYMAMIAEERNEKHATSPYKLNAVRLTGGAHRDCCFYCCIHIPPQLHDVRIGSTPGIYQRLKLIF